MRFLRRVLCLTVIFCLVLGMLSMTFADDAPSDEPTEAPTDAPTAPPTEEPPTESETPAPTEEPPTEAPTPEPTEAPPAPTTPQPPAPTSTRPWTPTPTQPWSPTPTEPPTESETWPWDSNEERAAVIHVDLPRPVSVPDDTNIESRGEDGRLHYTIPGTWTASDVISWFVLNYGLDSENFAVSFYCPETGERAAYNENTYMFAASTYKLPLNMYYYDQQAAGVWTDDTLIGETRLADAHVKSILYSINDISEEMIYQLGSFRRYKQLMLDNYGKLEPGLVPSEYYANNYYCTHFMLNVLTDLYARQEEFPELLKLMKAAMPERYFKRYSGTTPVAHKYGTFEGCYHDVGIVYTEQPFLLAVYTRNIIGKASGEDLCGRVCLAMMAWQEREIPPEPAPTESTEPVETVETGIPETDAILETDAPAAETEPAPAQTGGTPWYFIAFPIVIAVGVVATFVVFRRRR